MSITGGSVTFEQSRKLAEYENRKVIITFNVNEPEGQNATGQVLEALDIAKAHVLIALGFATKDSAPAAAAAPKAPAVDPTDISAPAAAAKPGRKKPPIVVDLKANPAPADASAVQEPAGDASSVVEDPKSAAAPTGEAASGGAPTSDASAVDEDIFSPTPAEVTDTELLAAISRKNQSLQLVLGPAAPPKIRALIGKYVQPPKAARDIPQEVRAKFIQELDALSA